MTDRELLVGIWNLIGWIAFGVWVWGFAIFAALLSLKGKS